MAAVILRNKIFFFFLYFSRRFLANFIILRRGDFDRFGGILYLL